MAVSGFAARSSIGGGSVPGVVPGPVWLFGGSEASGSGLDNPDLVGSDFADDSFGSCVPEGPVMGDKGGDIGGPEGWELATSGAVGGPWAFDTDVDRDSCEGGPVSGRVDG